MSSVWKPPPVIQDQLHEFAVYIGKRLFERFQLGDDYTECLTAILYLLSAATSLHFVAEAKRFASFPAEDEWRLVGNGWPAKSFAEAGFFYVNGDHVVCFFCDLGLSDWSPGDDPWFEHAKHFPLCFFVKAVKGLAYMQDAARASRVSVDLPSTYGQPDHGGLLDAIMKMWMCDASTAVKSVGIPDNDVLLYIAEVWIYNQRCASVQEIVETLQVKTALFCGLPNLVKTVEFYCKCKEKYSVLEASKAAATVSVESPAESAQDSTLEVQSVGKVPKEDTKKIYKPAKRVLVSGRTMSQNCVLCKKNKLSITCLPCAHLCMCENCAKTVKRCPEDGVLIKGFVKTYI